MEEDFEAKFQDILSENNLLGNSVILFSVQELAEVLEALNTASAVISQAILDYLQDKENYSMTEESVVLLRSLRPLAEAVVEEMTDDCDCELEEEDDEDD